MEIDSKTLDFFKTFARFEYALKAAGYHCGDGEAKANWSAFARSEPIEKLFKEPISKELQDAIQYFTDDPPKKQVVRDGILNWEDTPITTNLKSDRVLIYIRRVRNNLFHGGKFHKHRLDSGRNEELMNHSLVYLNTAYKLIQKSISFTAINTIQISMYCK